MKDPRYDFPITVSAHIILDNKGKILLVKRPSNWEWAQGRWSLTGGKVYKHESLYECIKRKTKQELGFGVEPEGLYKVMQLIIANKQALMFFFSAKYQGEKFSGEMTDYKWMDLKSIKSMKSREYAEYYYKDMFIKYFEGDMQIFPIESVESLDYIKIGTTNNYKNWFKGAISKNYNPEDVPDFQKWKKNGNNS